MKNDHDLFGCSINNQPAVQKDAPLVELMENPDAIVHYRMGSPIRQALIDVRKLRALRR